MWIVKLDSDLVVVWQKCVGGAGDDEAYDVHLTSDGKIVVVGYMTNENGDKDMAMVVMDSDGNILSQKTFGGSNDDMCKAIVETSDGKMLMVGKTNSDDGDVTSSHGNGDIWVVKVDENGNMEWQKCLGGTGDEEGNAVVKDENGNIVLIGSTKSNDSDVSGNHGGYDYWVVKLNNDGSFPVCEEVK